MATAIEVIAKAEEIARKYRFDDDKRTRLISDAWYLWSTASDQSLPPISYVWTTSRRIWSRDLPGCNASQRDIYQRLTKWDGASMALVMDRTPNQDKSTEETDWLLWFATTQLNPQQRMLLELTQDGVETTNELARIMGLSPGRVSRLRREIFEKSKVARQ